MTEIKKIEIKKIEIKKTEIKKIEIKMTEIKNDHASKKSIKIPDFVMERRTGGGGVV